MIQGCKLENSYLLIVLVFSASLNDSTVPVFSGEGPA